MQALKCPICNKITVDQAVVVPAAAQDPVPSMLCSVCRNDTTPVVITVPDDSLDEDQ